MLNVPRVPKEAKEGRRENRVVLALGEATGHSHCLVAPSKTIRLFEHPDGGRYLIVDEPSVLEHQEHGQIAIEPGTYFIVPQRERSLTEVSRRVSD